jgi:anti-sigma B factor antagonist
MTTFEARRRPLAVVQSSPPKWKTPFDVEIQPAHDRVIVIPKGELDMATVDQLGASIDGLVDAGFEMIVLDLRRLTFMDSTGLRLIVSESRRPDVSIRLIDGTEVVARVFDLCAIRDQLPFIHPREPRLRH